MAILIAIVCIILFPELLLFVFAAMGMSLIYTMALNSFYEKNSYYKKKKFLWETFGFGTGFAVIAIPIGVFLSHGGGTFLGGLVSLPIMVIFLVAYYVSETRHAPEEDKAMNEALAKLLEATERYSEYAYMVLYYPEHGYIRAQVIVDKSSKEERIDLVCPGYLSALERFASYAEANHINQVHRHKEHVTCVFEQNRYR